MFRSIKKLRTDEIASTARALLSLSTIMILVSCASIDAQNQTSTAHDTAVTTICKPLPGGPYETIDFYFGLSIRGDAHGVTERDWTKFSAEHLAEAFPDGYSGL